MKLEGRKDIHFAVWSVLISMKENNKGRKTNTHIQKQTLEREKKLKTFLRKTSFIKKASVLNSATALTFKVNGLPFRRDNMQRIKI